MPLAPLQEHRLTVVRTSALLVVVAVRVAHAAVTVTACLQLVICTLYATAKSKRFFVAMSKVLWHVFCQVRHPKSVFVRMAC